MRANNSKLGWRFWLTLAALCCSWLPMASGQTEAPTQQPNETNTSAESTDPGSPPAMFPHPETDRLWISGQANIISQWHPAFHSPYSGKNSLSAQAQDASSRVLTLFTGLRLTNTFEIICDVQETGGHGVGEALGLAGFLNMELVPTAPLRQPPSA